MDSAIHACDKQIAAMSRVREAADKLEKVVPDDLLAAAEVRGDALHPLAGDIPIDGAAPGPRRFDGLPGQAR